MSTKLDYQQAIKEAYNDEDKSLTVRPVGGLVPDTHDYVSYTYVAAGDGVGEIETVTYKVGGAGGTTVAVLTMTYDASDRLASVTRS